MRLSILRWQSQGLRCPDTAVHVADVDGLPSSVTFVQMPNGTGKTTTLKLLRAALSGGADEWHEDRVRSFQKAGDDVSGQGRFILDLDANGVPLTIEMSFDFELGRVTYRTSSTSLGGSNPGFDPPAALSSFLRPQFVDLFVFDAEEAANLLSPEKTRAKQAIDELFQISTLRGIQRAFHEHWESHAGSVSAIEQKGYNRRRNARDKLRERLIMIRQERVQLLRKERRLSEEVAKRRHNFDDAIRKDEAAALRLDQLQTAATAAENEVTRLNEAAIGLMRDPYRVGAAFGIQLVQLKSHLDKLKLPTSTSRQFFEDLLEEENCICGRPLDDTTRTVIRAGAEEFLDDDEVGVLNTIKGDISVLLADQPSQLTRELDKTLEELNDAVYQTEEVDRQIRLLMDARVQAGGTELEDLRTAAEHGERQLEEIRERIAEIQKPRRGDEASDSSSIKALEYLLEDAENKLAEVTNTLELKRKTGIVEKVLVTATNRARQALGDELLTATNKTIATLLRREPVRLSAIHDHLILAGQTEASVGQTLSVGYAFLSTLFGYSGYQFPFIVDSPAGPLDLGNRPPVARLIPKLCHQFLCFIISSERDRFVEPLEAEATGSVRYLTVFRKSSATADLLLALPAGVLETVDGAVVEGREFFARFDVEDEEEGEEI